jgi:membrane associated rhomboid family serine protease
MNNFYEFTNRRKKRFFLDWSVTWQLIVLNVFFFIFIKILIWANVFPIQYIALSPSLLFEKYYVWTLLTSMFAHQEIWHLLANMFSLFFIGKFVEKLIGRKRFFWLYIVAGLFAGIFYAGFSYLFGSGLFLERIFSNPEGFALGASGAIFSLLGLLAVLTPKNKVSLIAGPLVGIILYAVLNTVLPNSSLVTVFGFLINIYIILSLFFMFSFNPKLMRLAMPINMNFLIIPIVAIVPLIVIGLFIPLPIGNTAHLGGLIVGLVYGMILRNRFPKKVKYINSRFS